MQIPDGVTVPFTNASRRLVTSELSNDTTQLTPWYVNYLGGNWSEASACMGAGSNSWQAMHETLNRGLTNEWVVKNTPWSWGHFNRQDIPTHFDIAEGWTVADMYQVRNSALMRRCLLTNQPRKPFLVQQIRTELFG